MMPQPTGETNVHPTERRGVDFIGAARGLADYHPMRKSPLFAGGRDVMTDGTGSVLDNGYVQAGQRFEALSRLFDPWTLRHVGALGIQPGWRCGEVGAGGPNVPRQLGPASVCGDTCWPPTSDPRRRLG